MRCNISSYVAVSGALAPESLTILANWDLERSARENAETSSAIQALSRGSEKLAAFLAKATLQRFELPGRDNPLVILARRCCPMAIWRPILLWHVTEHDALVRRFLEEWLFPAYREGRSTLRAVDLIDFVAELRIEAGGVPFNEGTLKRTTGGLLKFARDFGLLEGDVVKRFCPHPLPETAILYILHSLAERHASGRKTIDAPDWRRFLMSPSEVEHELYRLHQRHLLDYQVAGSMAQLTLPCSSVGEFAGICEL